MAAMETRLPARMQVGVRGSSPAGWEGVWVGLLLGQGQRRHAASSGPSCPGQWPGPALPQPWPPSWTHCSSSLPRVWKGLLTWGQQHAGAALNTDTIYSFAMEPAKRLGQGDGEVGRLPVEGSLLCVYTPVIPDQAVDDGWTA